MTKKVPLTQGKFAIVDDEDYQKVIQFKWHYNKTGYAHHTHHYYDENGDLKSKKIKMHRFILGIDDPKIFVDHIDGNGLNNTKANLRICNNQQNLFNRKKRNNTTSKYKGVYFDKKRNKYQAYIHVDYKKKHLGYFETEAEAAQAYNEAALKYFGEFARLNEIKEDDLSDFEKGNP